MLAAERGRWSICTAAIRGRECPVGVKTRSPPLRGLCRLPPAADICREQLDHATAQHRAAAYPAIARPAATTDLAAAALRRSSFPTPNRTNGTPEQPYPGTV